MNVKWQHLIHLCYETLYIAQWYVTLECTMIASRCIPIVVVLGIQLSVTCYARKMKMYRKMFCFLYDLCESLLQLESNMTSKTHCKQGASSILFRNSLKSPNFLNELFTKTMPQKWLYIWTNQGVIVLLMISIHCGIKTGRCSLREVWRLLSKTMSLLVRLLCQ